MSSPRAQGVAGAVGSIRYLGLSGFEIVTSTGQKVLINPALTANPSAPFAVADLGSVELVLVSHGSRFVLGDALTIVRQTGATLLCGPDVRVHAIRSGVDSSRILTLVPGGTRVVNGIRVKAVPSVHGSFLESDGVYLSSQSMGFVIFTPGGCIYYAGTTSLFSDMQLIGQLYKPDVVILPIGAMPGGSGLIQMDVDEALIAISWLRPRIVIPMVFADRADAERFAAAVPAVSPATNSCVLDPGLETAI